MSTIGRIRGDAATPQHAGLTADWALESGAGKWERSVTIFTLHESLLG
jgi:hypothetical protein